MEVVIWTNPLAPTTSSTLRIAGVSDLSAGLKIVEKLPRMNDTARTSGREKPTKYKYAASTPSPRALTRSESIIRIRRLCLSTRVPPTKLSKIEAIVLDNARYAMSSVDPVVTNTSQVSATCPSENPPVEVAPAEKSSAKLRLRSTRNGLPLLLGLVGGSDDTLSQELNECPAYESCLSVNIGTCIESTSSWLCKKSLFVDVARV